MAARTPKTPRRATATNTRAAAGKTEPKAKSPKRAKTTAKPPKTQGSKSPKSPKTTAAAPKAQRPRTTAGAPKAQRAQGPNTTAAAPKAKPRGRTTPQRPATIDAYLAGVPPDRRAALQSLRALIHQLAPGATECISYSMPAFRVGGRVVAGFLATSAGCSYFPFSGTTLATLADQLAGYGQTKSALHFSPESPLPKALVKKLLAARIAETA